MKYQGFVEAASGFLLGGVKKHYSTPFKTQQKAQAWITAIVEGNEQAGRKVGQTSVYPVYGKHLTGGSKPTRKRMRKNPRGLPRGQDIYQVGDRVELHPATDWWMRGARFGDVIKVKFPIATVKLDKVKRPVRVHVDNIGKLISRGSERIYEPRGGWNKNPRNDTAVELALFIENDGQIYRSQTLPIIKNLQRKIAKGTYDPQKALKLWRHLADRGAHDYFKQHGEPHTTTWFQMFSTADRNNAAKILAERYEEHVREAQPTRVIRRRRNPVVGKFHILGHARGRTWYYRHSTQSFTDAKEKGTAYRSRAHAESIAKSLLRRLPQSIESITVKT